MIPFANIHLTSRYDMIKLDTLSSMGAAQKMYADMGFVDVEQYCVNPVEGTRFLGLELR